MTEDKIFEMIRNWAEHAAQPFQGHPKKDVEKQLVLAIETAIKRGAAVIGEIAGVEFGYKWDSENEISVEMDKTKFTGEMLIIRGSKCAE